ncbi:MAG: hypothetical protein NTU97_01495 [Candidatus Magasanikbacteria bacterium]|nr:hypothetical protein [Candidatus Magasanikbacteria bacterium]
MYKFYTRKFNFTHKLAVLILALAIILDLGFPQFVVAEARAAFIPSNPGTALPESPDRAPRKVVTTVVSVYSSTVDQTDDTPFLAANGPVHDGMVAANWLPFGTQVRFPEIYGDKIFTVGDRMNAKYGYGRVDIWKDAPRAELMQFGIKRLKMEIF